VFVCERESVRMCVFRITSKVSDALFHMCVTYNFACVCAAFFFLISNFGARDLAQDLVRMYVRERG